VRTALTRESRDANLWIAGLTSRPSRGFTSIRSATVQLGQSNVLVCANGAGKINFVQASLLGRIEAGER
jgi:predicted ATPase